MTADKFYTRTIDYVLLFISIVFGLIVFFIAVPVIVNWPFAVKLFSAVGLM